MKYLVMIGAQAFGRSMKKVKVLMLFACGLFAECGGNSKKDTHVQEVGAVVVDSSRQDTIKKQAPAAPEINEEAMQRAIISRKDSSFHVYNNIRADYRIIGYQLPDPNSKKMVLFSIFTSDVKDNPFHCPYGAYYDLGYPLELVIKYTGEQDSFIKATISGSSKKPATVYFEKRWVEFEE